MLTISNAETNSLLIDFIIQFSTGTKILMSSINMIIIGFFKSYEISKILLFIYNWWSSSFKTWSSISWLYHS